MANATNNLLTNTQPITTEQNSPILEMPLDVVLEIVKRVKWNDVGPCQLTCKSWNQLFSNEGTWQTLLENHFRHYRIPKELQNFKEAYQDQYQLNLNISNGVYASEKLRGDGLPVFSFAVSEGNLLSGHHTTVDVWDLNTNTQLETISVPAVNFFGGLQPITSLKVFDGKLCCGYLNGTIKILDLMTNNCLATFESSAHVISDGKLFTSHSDGTIKVWDLNTNTCLATFKGDKNVVTLAVSDWKLFAGRSDGIINVWDIRKNTCVASLRKHTHSIRSFAVFDRKLYSGSSDKTIKIWDLNTLACLATLNGHTNMVRMLTVSNGNVFSGSSDKTIKIWDLNTLTCLATLEGHTDNLSSIAVSNGKVISNSSRNQGHEHAINVCDFNAKHSTVFEELADMLDSGSSDTIKQALDRFSRMPKAARNKIYGELYKILKPLDLIQNDYLGCGEDAFHDLQGQSSTPAQKAQAIRKYLQQ